jgi:hypothetical protein
VAGGSRDRTFYQHSPPSRDESSQKPSPTPGRAEAPKPWVLMLATARKRGSRGDLHFPLPSPLAAVPSTRTGRARLIVLVYCETIYLKDDGDCAYDSGLASGWYETLIRSNVISHLRTGKNPMQQCYNSRCL